MTNQKNRKVNRMIALAILAFFFFIQVLTIIGGVEPDNFIPLDGDISTTVYKSDGSVERYDDGNFGNAKAGDTILVDIDLSKYRTEEARSLCFFMYNSVVDVLTHGQVLHTYGGKQLKSKQLIGDVLYMVYMPQVAYTEGVQIRIVPQQGFNVGFFDHLLLMPTEDARLYPLIGQGFTFLVITGIFGFSLLMGIILLFLRFVKVGEKPGVQLMFFTFLISTWYLGYQHMFYCMTNSLDFCADVEYIALYLAPIPLCRYLRGHRKSSQRVFSILSYFYIALFLIATVLNYSHTGLFYSVLLPVLHFFMIVTMICMYVFAIVHKNSINVQERVASLGTRAFVICLVLELVRIYLGKFFSVNAPILKTLFTSGAVIIIAATLFVGYGAYIVQNFSDRQEKTKYKQIAYRDFLSGIPNRNACLEGLQDWKDRGIKLYTLFFLDVNFLKTVNDQYGHDMGDQLLVVVASALQATSAKTAFFGRWGGDEFLAGFEDVVAAGEFEDEFNAAVQQVNETAPLPFEVSVAVGRVDSDLFHPMDPLDAVQMADQNMYQQKREAHKSREV